MALNATDALATFDQVTNKKLDISPVLSAILLNDTATLGLLGQGPAVMRSEHFFGEDSLNAPTVQLDGAEDDTDTAWVLDDTSKIRVGALLMDEATGVTEIAQVTEITNATDVVVERGFGGTTAAAHADDAVFAIVGQPTQEGDETVADISKDRTQETNYTQIFRRTVKVTGTQEAEANNGIHPGVSSELRYQIAQRAQEMAVELNRAVLNSYANSTTSVGSDTQYRSMKGIRQWLTEGSDGAGLGANHQSGGGAFDETKLNALYKLAWDKGGNPTTLLGNAEQINKFSSFNANRFRVAPSDRQIGVFIEKFLTEFGVEISLNIDRWARKDELYLLDTSKAYFAPLQGRAMFTEPLPKIGDSLRWQMVMEMTTVVQNKKEAHAIASALT